MAEQMPLLRKATSIAIGILATIALGATCAYLTTFNVVQVWEYFDPLLPYEAAGSQFAVGLFLMMVVTPAGFIAGCVLASVAWWEIAQNWKRRPATG